jgi:hypothetical protein
LARLARRNRPSLTPARVPAVLYASLMPPPEPLHERAGAWHIKGRLGTPGMCGAELALLGKVGKA